jgi:hypothetical protein
MGKLGLGAKTLDQTHVDKETGDCPPTEANDVQMSKERRTPTTVAVALYGERNGLSFDPTSRSSSSSSSNLITSSIVVTIPLSSYQTSIILSTWQPIDFNGSSSPKGEGGPSSWTAGTFSHPSLAIAIPLLHLKLTLR